MQPTEIKQFHQKNTLLLLTLVCLYTILRGIRFPNIWSYTHYLFNYDHGFVKRGLLGNLIQSLNNDFLLSYQGFFLLSLLLFGLSLGLFFLLTQRILILGNTALNFCLFLFFSSPAIIFLVHTLGYFDHIALLVTLCIISTNSINLKFIIAFPGFLFCLFCHEGAFIIFFPVVCLSFLVCLGKACRALVPTDSCSVNGSYFLSNTRSSRFNRDKGNQQKPQTIPQSNISISRSGIFHYGLLVLFILICTLITCQLSQSILSETQATSAYHDMQKKTAIPLRSDAYHVQHLSRTNNRELMKQQWHGTKRIGKWLVSTFKTFPTALFISFILFRLQRQSHHRLWLIIAAPLAAYSPLLLNIFATDMNRFHALCITTGILVFFVVVPICQKPIRIQSSKTLRWVFMLLFTTNLFLTIQLFDGFKVRQFPFITHINYIESLFLKTAVFPDIPLK